MYLEHWLDNSRKLLKEKFATDKFPIHEKFNFLNLIQIHSLFNPQYLCEWITHKIETPINLH